MTTLSALTLATAGFVASVINVVAGGGSFLTLPLLIFLGLPAGEANATNRVGVVAQNLAAVWGFHRHRVLDWTWSLSVALPGTLGAGLGAWLALHVGDREFQRFLAFAMLALTLWTLVDPGESLVRRGSKAPAPRWVVNAGFFLVGVYCGFVQAGVGFLFLAVSTLAGLDLLRGNAAKVLSILFQTLLSLAIFAWEGRVRWDAGLALAAGSVVGSLVGVRLTVVKGQRWLQGAVTAAVVLFAIRLWFS